MGTDFDSFTKKNMSDQTVIMLITILVQKNVLQYVLLFIIVLLLLRHTIQVMYYYDKHEREKDDITRNQAFFCR